MLAPHEIEIETCMKKAEEIARNRARGIVHRNLETKFKEADIEVDEDAFKVLEKKEKL